MTSSSLPCILALDCGATSVRAMVVDSLGHIIGRSRQANNTRAGLENESYHIWDAEHIFEQLCECSREATKDIASERIKAVTVTTFGVDGGLVDDKGQLLYPVISWKCPRTAEVMEKVGLYITQEELNAISGVGKFAFNTIYKLIWLKENHPELLEKAKAWLFISSFFTCKLSGVMTTDRTMAGTSQLTDLKTGDFSEAILSSLGIKRSLFPPLVAAGEKMGALLPEMAERLGIAGAEAQVVSTGHDTQFAVFGSGAELNQPVLSSGTWEILMVRTPEAHLSLEDYGDGATAEYDGQQGLLNPGLQWLGSGVIEWIKALAYKDDSYDLMDEEALNIVPGCEGVRLVPDFLPSGASQGSISGLVLGRTRAHLYRATLEALSLRLRSRLKRLESISGFNSQSLILVGGGAKNKVWSQIRANILGLPIQTTSEPEITVLGAAMFAFSGAGVYASPEKSREAFALSYEFYYPNEQEKAYEELFPC